MVCQGRPGLDAARGVTMNSVGFEVAEDLEEELPARLRSRPEAIAELFDGYRDRILRMIVVRLDPRLVGKLDAEDVLQDVYLETAHRVSDFLKSPTVPFFVWLRQIASQILIDTHRRYLGAERRDVRKEVPFQPYVGGSASAQLAASQLADSLTTPSQCAIRQEACAALQRASYSEHLKSMILFWAHPLARQYQPVVGQPRHLATPPSFLRCQRFIGFFFASPFLH